MSALRLKPRGTGSAARRPAAKSANRPSPSAWVHQIWLPQSDGPDQAVEVDFVPNSRAKRLILKLDPKSGRPRVTVPFRCPSDRAMAFAQDQAAWIQRVRDKQAAVSLGPLTWGQSIPVGGEEVELTPLSPSVPNAAVRGKAGVHQARIFLPAQAPIEASVLGYLRAQAKLNLPAKVQHYLSRLNQLERAGQGKDFEVSKIRITDTKSRWGSCSSRGVISLSLRLMMAPEWIQAYVAAHEVAHLAQPNHSSQFWQLNQRLMPEANVEQARAYLKQHGPRFMSLGAA